ncbi:MAG: DUF1538 domain-containing protein [Candidatus Ancaeobacter aquaticus]|nr:DUF1538 domain-containing protein [Candidatus Ancaeobacter aquaticus]
MNILLRYFTKILKETIRAVLPVSLFLIMFQLLILRAPIYNFMSVLFGLLLITLGLMIFLEGLKYGLMPLGQSVGSLLPQKTSLLVILIFSFLVGYGVTVSEPAINALKIAAGGSTLAPLQNKFLVPSIGVGVGVAVVLGILRIVRNLSLVLFVLPLVVLCGVLSYFAPADYLSLAWDCGAITTGPVSVPIILSLGIGVATVTKGCDPAMAGFGIVAIASLMPIISVLTLGIVSSWM